MITKEIVRDFVENNPRLVLKKKTSIPGVYVLKYHNRCFYDGIWNEVIENTRGAVIDEDYNLITNPLRKIYNFGIEKEAPKINDDEKVIAIRKVNGFMLAVSWHEGNFLFSTTGTIDSKYVDYGKEMFYKAYNGHHVEDSLSSIIWLTNKEPKETIVFECVHPEDPHIIPETIGIYPLIMRENQWGSDVTRTNQFFDRIEHSLGEYLHFPQIISGTMGEIKKLVKGCNHEGYVIYCDDGRTTKIKSPYYLIKKFLARCNKTEKLLDSCVKERFDEEYYPLIDHIQENLDSFTLLSEQERLEYIRSFLGNYLNEKNVQK